jgi:hypothetical protein
MDEYLASTREPVGSRNVFGQTPDPLPSTKATGEGPRREDQRAAGPLAIALFLVCAAGLLIGALAYMVL